MGGQTLERKAPFATTILKNRGVDIFFLEIMVLIVNLHMNVFFGRLRYLLLTCI